MIGKTIYASGAGTYDFPEGGSPLEASVGTRGVSVAVGATA
jgi:hypothetical protein